MRTNRFIGICLCVLAVGQAARGQTFTPNLRGTFSDPIGAGAEGLGTAALRFADGDPVGGLRFTAAPDIAPAAAPFLVGRIDFTAGGLIPFRLTFDAAADVFARDCTPGTLEFKPAVTFEEFDEPGFRQQKAVFGPANGSTVEFDGTAYTLAFAGLSATTAWDPDYGTALAAVVGQEEKSAYLFATLDPAPPRVADGPPEECDCNPPAVPEPATWLLGALGACGAALYRRRLAGGGKR